MVYVLDENDRDCLTIRIDWSKGRYSPIPKATCEMLNRGCGCNCSKTKDDEEPTLELTCDELKKFLALGGTKPKPEPKEAIPCITEKDFDRLLEEYKYFERFGSQEMSLGLGVYSFTLGTNQGTMFFSPETEEEEFKVKLKERLENFEPFKGKYFFDVSIEKTDGVTELGYTKFGGVPYNALISCYIEDHSYCFTNCSFYIGLSQNFIEFGDKVPIVTNDGYDNQGVSTAIQESLNYDRDTTFGVIKYNGNKVLSVDNISEEDKQTVYTKLENKLFNGKNPIINKGSSTVKFTLGEPTVQVGDVYKEQEYTVPITIEVTTGNYSGTVKSTIPMETREVAE